MATPRAAGGAGGRPKVPEALRGVPTTPAALRAATDHLYLVIGECRGIVEKEKARLRGPATDGKDLAADEKDLATDVRHAQAEVQAQLVRCEDLATGAEASLEKFGTIAAGWGVSELVPIRNEIARALRKISRVLKEQAPQIERVERALTAAAKKPITHGICVGYFMAVRAQLGELQRMVALAAEERDGEADGRPSTRFHRKSLAALTRTVVLNCAVGTQAAASLDLRHASAEQIEEVQKIGGSIIRERIRLATYLGTTNFTWNELRPSADVVVERARRHLFRTENEDLVVLPVRFQAGEEPDCLVFEEAEDPPPGP